MNTHVKGIDYSGAKVLIDGELVDYDAVILGFGGAPTGGRDIDLFYKALFDGLNNRKSLVCLPHGECALPVW
jgi:hypothetical protein